MAAAAYDPSQRSPRMHKRVVFTGKQGENVDNDRLESSKQQQAKISQSFVVDDHLFQQRSRLEEYEDSQPTDFNDQEYLIHRSNDDDSRFLNELPPHWGIFRRS